MNRYVSCGLGLFMAASAFSAMAAPSMGQASSSAVVKSPVVAKASTMSSAVNAPIKAFQQVKPCPYRRS
ncbi:MAG: hypothetical protein EOP38_27750 [Rubrivivax sp.]|nr:MAG: hypothetical protein EOP38_27750 [Rubrivivax sp.]